MDKACNSILFWPRPLGPGEGSKGQISLSFNYKKIKDFIYQTLCVFSQIKEIKHTEWDCHSVAWVLPLGAGGSNI